MTQTTNVLPDTSFKKDTYKGLTNEPKYLLSKYIYDKKGDALFQDIMNMPSYYLTSCEFEVIDTYKQKLSQYFNNGSVGFDLIELGAGDGKKTKILLRNLLKNQINFKYKPIDISQNAIDSLTEKLNIELPEIEVAPENGEYFEVLKRIKTFTQRKKVILVLGSNIGNLSHSNAIDFLTHLKNTMGKDDLLFMGFDQKKNPQTILDAYNDKEGITAAFNKNLLHRINIEMGANFDPTAFTHWETYDPESGTAKSYLVAQKEMEVTIEALHLTIHFDQWETIHTEISQKYNDKVVRWLASESGLEIEDSFEDSKQYYKNYLFKKI